MKVEHFITLTQPWATLVALGAKVEETRGWRTSFRGPLAIHAGKGFPPECRLLCLSQPYLQVLAAAGFRDVGDLPRGQVLCVAELWDCVPTERIRMALSEQEYAFGNYDDGRYVLRLRNVRRLKEPRTLRGGLSIRRLPTPILDEDLS